MFRKKTRHLLVFLCTAILVWSQLALSAYACPQFDFLPVQATASASNMSGDCAAKMTPDLSPLCKAHCEQSPQSSQTPSIDIPPLALVSTDIVALSGTFASALTQADNSRPLWLTDASPPLRIQYQVFRN